MLLLSSATRILATELPPGILPFSPDFRCRACHPRTAGRLPTQRYQFALLADSRYSSTGIWRRQRQHGVGVSEGNTLKREYRNRLWKSRKFGHKRPRAQPGLRSWTVSYWVSSLEFECRVPATSCGPPIAGHEL